MRSSYLLEDKLTEFKGSYAADLDSAHYFSVMALRIGDVNLLQSRAKAALFVDKSGALFHGEIILTRLLEFLNNLYSKPSYVDEPVFKALLELIEYCLSTNFFGRLPNAGFRIVQAVSRHQFLRETLVKDFLRRIVATHKESIFSQGQFSSLANDLSLAVKSYLRSPDNRFQQASSYIRQIILLMGAGLDIQIAVDHKSGDTILHFLMRMTETPFTRDQTVIAIVAEISRDYPAILPMLNHAGENFLDLLKKIHFSQGRFMTLYPQIASISTSKPTAKVEFDENFLMPPPSTRDDTQKFRQNLKLK